MCPALQQLAIRIFSPQVCDKAMTNGLFVFWTDWSVEYQPYYRSPSEIKQASTYSYPAAKKALFLVSILYRPAGSQCSIQYSSILSFIYTSYYFIISYLIRA